MARVETTPEAAEDPQRPTPLQSVGRGVCHVARLAIVLGLPALLLAWFVPIDAAHPPAQPPTLELLASRIETLRFHIGVALLVATLCLLLARAGRFAVVGVVLTAWALVPALTWPSVERSPRTGSAVLRVLSLNLGGALGETPRVLAAIDAGQPDVLVLQEYTPAWRGALATTLAERFPARHERVRTDNFGMAVFARQAWSRREHLQLAASGTPQMRFELRLDGQVIQLYALHLIPPSAPRYAQHRAEFADLLRRLAEDERPTVLLGDFNFVDHGALAGALHERGFHDAHGIAGTGRGATWPAHGSFRYVPGIRIDHVYLGHGLTATASWVGGHTGSDHLPVGAAIVLAED